MPLTIPHFLHRIFNGRPKLLVATICAMAVVGFTAAGSLACFSYDLTAESAAQAYDLLQRQHVDVLLADIGMPDEDGYSLIRKVRAMSAAAASIPAAALTAFARDEDRQQALQAGFQLHLAKPIDAQSLVAAVANLGRLNVA